MTEFFSEVVEVLQLRSLWAVLFAALAASVVWNAVNRARWEIAWTNAGHAGVKIPERRWTYDARDLDAFAQTARSVSEGTLPSYVSILRGSDLWFAAFVAAVSAYIWWRIAVTAMDFAFINWAALPLGAMAILYGIADVAEDLKLASILQHPAAVDQAEVAATNALTRIKFVTISLSLIGLVIFGLYSVVEKCAVWLLGRLERQRATA